MTGTSPADRPARGLDASDRTLPGGALPRLATWPVLAVAAAVAAAHVWAAARPSRYYDETLTVAIGLHHLDWGAADQPPVAPLLAALADRLAPGSQLAIATPAILATVAAVVTAALLAREFGGDTRAQVLAALAQATGLSFTLTGHWLTPYSLEPVVWLAIAWVLLRWIRLRDDRLLLVLGVAIGVGVQTKFQVLGFCAVLLVCVAVLGPRALLGRPTLWVAVGIAAAIATPTLLWQAAHGWPQLAMAPRVAAQAVHYGGRTGIAEALIYYAGFLGLGLIGIGLLALLTSPEHGEHRFLAAAFVVLFLIFALLPGRANYLVGLYGVPAAAGAAELCRRRRAGRTRWRWVAWPAAVLSVVLAGWMLGQSVSKASPVVADAVVATASRAYASLPPAQRERTVLVGDTYIYASYLDTAPPATGLPKVVSGNVSYGYFAPPSEELDTALLVDVSDVADVERFRPFFDEVRPVTRMEPGPEARGRVGGETPTTVWLLTGKRASWPVIMSAVRSL